MDTPYKNAASQSQTIACIGILEDGLDLTIKGNLGLHILVNKPRHARPALVPAKRSPKPLPTRDELKGTRRNFGPGRGHTDDHALAPTPVSALEGSSHGVDETNGLKGVVNTIASLGHAHEHLCLESAIVVERFL